MNASLVWRKETVGVVGLGVVERKSDGKRVSRDPGTKRWVDWKNA